MQLRRQHSILCIQKKMLFYWHLQLFLFKCYDAKYGCEDYVLVLYAPSPRENKLPGYDKVCLTLTRSEVSGVLTTPPHAANCQSGQISLGFPQTIKPV
mgnify:CR=1 FL=1